MNPQEMLEKHIETAFQKHQQIKTEREQEWQIELGNAKRAYPILEETANIPWIAKFTQTVGPIEMIWLNQNSRPAVTSGSSEKVQIWTSKNQVLECPHGIYWEPKGFVPVDLTKYSTETLRHLGKLTKDAAITSTLWNFCVRNEGLLGWTGNVKTKLEEMIPVEMLKKANTYNCLTVAGEQGKPYQSYGHECE
jgi:hypothetical protein